MLRRHKQSAANKSESNGAGRVDRYLATFTIEDDRGDFYIVHAILLAWPAGYGDNFGYGPCVRDEQARAPERHDSPYLC
jgi:hypothetical protein